MGLGSVLHLGEQCCLDDARTVRVKENQSVVSWHTFVILCHFRASGPSIPPPPVPCKESTAKTTNSFLFLVGTAAWDWHGIAIARIR